MKKYINLICVILTILIIFNFSYKPYAELVLGSIAIKVVATILASMGVLSFVNENGGIQGFYNGLITWLETKKGMINAVTEFADIGINAITNNAKMKISNKVNLIKEYWNTLKWELPENPDDPFDIKDGAIGLLRDNISMKFVDFDLSGGGFISSSSIGNGYELKLYITRAFQQLNITGIVSYNGTNISSQKITNLSGGHSTNNDINIDIQLQYKLGEIIMSGYVDNLSTNKSFDLYKTQTVESLLGLEGIDAIPRPIVDDIPVPKTVPLGLAMPWDYELLNQSEVIGKNIEELIEMVGSISLDSYVEKLGELPKAIIDSIEMPQVIVDEQGIITGINESVIPEIIPDIKEQTGILEGIGEGINTITNKIENIFKSPEELEIEKVELDFSPLSGFILKDKFPFSLPWDLTAAVNLLVAPPVPPKFELPILTETIDIDFTQFESLAQISRSFFTIIFIVTLIILTRKFLG